MERRQWLRNDFTPSAVQMNTFTVEEDPIILVATGLAATDAIGVEVRGEARTMAGGVVEHYWSPLYRNGFKVELRGTNNQLVVIVPGTYRIVGGPPVGAVTVSLLESEKISEDRIIFNDIANALLIAASPAAAASCSSPPVADMDYFQVTRCDATTKAPVTLVYGAQKANNSVCPPIPAGVIALVGHISASGAFTAGGYPGVLSDCGCPGKTPLGEVSSWG